MSARPFSKLNRGQVGVVLLILTLLFILLVSLFTYQSYSNQRSVSVDAQDAFRTCVQRIADDMIRKVALTGGLPDTDAVRLDSAYHVAYWLDDGRILAPRIEDLTARLSTSIAQRISRECDDSIIFQQSPRVDVTLLKESVRVDVTPYAVQGTTRLKPVRVYIMYPLQDVLQRARSLTEAFHAFRILENISLRVVSLTMPVGVRVSCLTRQPTEEDILRKLVILIQSVSMNGTPRFSAPWADAITYNLSELSGYTVRLAPISRYAQLRIKGGPSFDSLRADGCIVNSLSWLSIDMPILIQIDRPGLPVPFRFAIRMRVKHTARHPNTIREATFCQDVTVDNLTLFIKDAYAEPIPKGDIIFSCPGGGTCRLPFTEGVFSHPIPWRCKRMTLRIEAPEAYPLESQVTLSDLAQLNGEPVFLEKSPRFTLILSGTCDQSLLALQSASEPLTLIPLTRETFTLPRKDMWQIVLLRDGQIMQKLPLPDRDARIRVNLANACIGRPALEVAEE